MDKTLVIELSDEEFKYFRILIDRFGFDVDVLLHRIFNWCFHSHYFWEKVKADCKMLV